MAQTMPELVAKMRTAASAKLGENARLVRTTGTLIATVEASQTLAFGR